MTTRALCIALALAAGLPSLEARALTIDFGGRPPAFDVSHPIRGGYYDVNQDTAALFTHPPTQQFESSNGVILYGIWSAEASAVTIRLPMYYSAQPETPAPEPGVLALIAAGLTLVGLRARRRSTD